jgi:ribosomal protein S18 acetylase RimI-like enzyme
MRLESMTSEERSAYLDRLVPIYGEDLSEAIGCSRAEGEAAGRKLLEPFRSGAAESTGFRLMDGEQTVGTAWLTAKGADAFLGDLRIDLAFRGRGHGKAAMEMLEEHARAAGCDRLRLHVFAHNEVARKLYERCGFEVASLQMNKRF